MHDPDRKLSSALMLVFGIFIGVAPGQATLAASQELASAQDMPRSAGKTAAVPMTGQQVYNNVCIACHSPPGVGGAPAFGNSEAWAPRIAQGMDILIDHALHGFSGNTGVMPRKGERPDLSDEEVIGAVKYMVEQIVP